MSDFVPLNPVGGFPNWIFCPKIVPLVYDDCLSYYEFLNKLMVKLNEVIVFANQINANTENLKQIVQRIETLVNGFDERITTNENDIADLKTAMTAVNNAIEGINSSIEDISGRVTDVENGLEALAENVQQQIDTAIIPLQTAVTNMQITIGNHEQRIEQLEDAAFENLSIAPIPFTFIMDVRNGNSKGIKIVQDSSSLASNSIQWVTGGGQNDSSIAVKARCPNNFAIPRFYTSGNPCHLVIPSVIPYKYKGSIDYTIYSYCQRWMGNTSTNTGIGYVDAVSMNSLLAEGGVQNTSTLQHGCLIDMELVVNEDTGDYDLYLYNGRNGLYANINDYMFTCLMLTTVNIDPQRTGALQRFYNLKNTAYNQLNAGLNPDAKISSAISSLRTELNRSILDVKTDMFDKAKIYNPTFTPTTDVTLVLNASKQYRDTFATLNDDLYAYRATFLDLTLDIDNLTSDTDIVIGTLDSGLPTGKTLDSRHNINVSMQAANNGVFGSIDVNGNIAIHAYGTFGATTRVRISSAFFSSTDITPV